MFAFWLQETDCFIPSPGLVGLIDSPPFCGRKKFASAVRHFSFFEKYLLFWGARLWPLESIEKRLFVLWYSKKDTWMTPWLLSLNKLWVKKKTPGDHRFWSILSFTNRGFWVPGVLFCCFHLQGLSLLYWRLLATQKAGADWLVRSLHRFGRLMSYSKSLKPPFWKPSQVIRGVEVSSPHKKNSLFSFDGLAMTQGIPKKQKNCVSQARLNKTDVLRVSENPCPVQDPSTLCILSALAVFLSLGLSKHAAQWCTRSCKNIKKHGLHFTLQKTSFLPLKDYLQGQ